MLKKAGTIISGVCIGYSALHVVVFYFIISVLLKGVGIKALGTIHSGLSGAQALNCMVLGFILYKVFQVDFQSQEEQFSLWFFVGNLVFVGAVILRMLF